MSDDISLRSDEACVSFLTPYLAGADMMRLHLESIRRFYPDAPIVISARGAGKREMEDYRARFGILYRIEDCSYDEAFRRLLERCDTRYACILDHDTILLASIDPMLRGLAEDLYDVAGIEERIRVPDRIWMKAWPESGGWLRFAPGYLDATFLLLERSKFFRKCGLKGLRSLRKPPAGWSWEAHYGLCERLERHHRLMPYHTAKYGLGNLLLDNGVPVLWHAWYGSHSARPVGAAPGEPGSEPEDSVVRAIVEDAERAFIADYPHPDLSGSVPAWWPECDLAAECIAIERKAVSTESRPHLFGRVFRAVGRRVNRLRDRALGRSPGHGR